MTDDRPSKAVLSLRFFGFTFAVVLGLAVVLNTLSGIVMLALPVVIIVAIVLSIVFISIGSATSNLGAKLLVEKDPEYQAWKKRGGRPYWDYLPSIITGMNALERQTGIREPKYTTFVPPKSWLYQCPKCGARVEKFIDVCWNCNYGADGDATAYEEKFGKLLDQRDGCVGGSCQKPEPPTPLTDWMPMGPS